MGTVNVVLGEDTRLNLILGQQLENAVTEVVFDFSAWQTTYGSGTLALSVQRPGDEMPYAVVLTTSGTDATWSVTNLDTAYKGVGHIQLTYTVGSAIKKSVVYKFTVYESLGANGEYPSPGQTWQEGIEDDIEGLRTDVDADHDELIDIREGADGVTYPSAGDAVRGQITDVKSDLILSDNTLHEIFEGYGMDNNYTLGTISDTTISNASSKGVTITQLSSVSFMLNGTATDGFYINIFKKRPVSGEQYFQLKCSDPAVTDSKINFTLGYFKADNTSVNYLTGVYLNASKKKVTYPEVAVTNRDYFYINSGATFTNAVFYISSSFNAESVIDSIKDPLDLYEFAPLGLGYQSYIEYDSVNGTITIPKDITYYSKKVNGNSDYKSLNASDPYVISNVDFAHLSTTSLKLVLDTSDWTFKVIPYDTNNTDTQRLVAVLRLKSGNFAGGLSTPYPWKIDGKPYGMSLEESAYNFVALGLGYQSYIEYDTVNETLTIPKDITYFKENANGNNDYKSLNASDPYVISNVNYNTIGSSSAKLVLDTSNWTFSIIPYTTKNNGKRLVACLRLKMGNFPGGLVTPYPWKIDGKPYGIDLPPFTYETDSIVKTIGHRGWHTAPENTIPSFKEARKIGCLRVETDVQFTASGTPVLLHDDTLNRTCCNASDGSSLGDTPVYISALTDAELENYDACTPSKWDMFNGTKIPTLEEFCRLCRDIGLKPDIELKTNANLNEQKIQTIIGIVAKYGLTNVTRYPSVSETYLTHVKNNSPTSPLELIVFDTVTDANITTMQGLKNNTNKVYVSLYAQSGSVPTDTDINKCIAAGIPMEASGVIAESANGIKNANPYISAFCNGSLLASNILYNNGIN